MINYYVTKSKGLIHEVSELKRSKNDFTIGDNDVVIKNKIIGINSLDAEIAYFGDIGTPYIGGSQNFGTIVDKGRKVDSSFAIGKHVLCYSNFDQKNIGSFSEISVINEEKLIGIKEKHIDIAEIASACGLQIAVGYTLITRVFTPSKSTTILVFDPLSDIGYVLLQFCAYKKYKTIGIVNKESELEESEKLGCSNSFFIRDALLEQKIKKASNNITLAIDSIGTRETKVISLKSLGNFGVYVSYLGPFKEEKNQIPMNFLRKKSLFITRANMSSYFSSKFINQILGISIFETIRAGIIKPKINCRFKFNELLLAHKKMLEGDLKYSNIITL